ncbi:DUF2059 domain-containing protein [Lentisphaerota bacterium ZTH]|nr:DUF2059 domain-containing protein [Lentisphaerota bacterium]WET07422.1 DUF2059 domain-containing protein [Lentisphaerota bacterium ZTH]
MKKLILVAVAGLIAVNVSAAAPKAAKRMKLTEKENAALQMLTAMRVEQNMQRSFEMMKKMQLDVMTKMMKNVKDKEATLKIRGKVFDMISKELSWDKFKNDFIKIYADIYTLDEMHGLTDFFKSKTGQAFLDKSPLVQQRMMPLIQKKVMAMMPQVQQYTKECIAQEMKKAPAGTGPKCGCDTHDKGKNVK